MPATHEELQRIAEEEGATQGAREFFGRVWSTPQETYRRRLEAIGFTGCARVLDAGCGFGQWLPALAALNGSVTGIEFDPVRVAAARRALALTGCHGVEVQQGVVEELPFADGSFDAVFSYSVVLCTNYPRTFREFARVLKPGGRLYFNTNGIGWYLHNLVDGHHSTPGFSSFDMAVDAIRNTIAFLSTGRNVPGQCIIMPRELTERAVAEAGLRILHTAAEGCINLTGVPDVKPFFAAEYYGLESIYEMICTK